MQDIPENLASLVVEIARENTIGKISAELLKQLFNGAFVAPDAFEMPVLLLIFADLLRSGTIDNDIHRMFVLLLDSLEERSLEFFQALEIIPGYYNEFLTAKPDFFDVLISRVYNFMATDRCPLARFAILAHVLASVMVVTQEDRIFQYCSVLFQREASNPERELILKIASNFVITNRWAFDGETRKEDMKVVLVRAPDSIFGVALNGDHFVIDTGRTAYSVTSGKSNDGPNPTEEANLFRQFLDTPSSAFLIGMASEIPGGSLKVLSSNADLAPLVNEIFDSPRQWRRSEFSVFYIGPSKSSERFRGFLSGIGTFTDSSEPVVVWQNLRHKAFFHVVSSPPDRPRRVAVAWVEQRGLPLGELFSEETKALIIAQPTDSAGFVRLSVRKRDARMRFGMIDKPVVVSRGFAAFVVRWTALLAAPEVDAAVAAEDGWQNEQDALWRQLPAGTPLPFQLFR
jgi:hypothetical protein